MPKTTTLSDDGNVEVIQPLTDIGAWREAVEENAESQVIEDTSSATSTEAIAYTEGAVASARAAMLSAGYVDTDVDDDDEFQYYTKPWEWTKATQYGDLQEFTVAIEDGKASITIPSSEVSALLLYSGLQLILEIVINSSRSEVT